ncbi:MAG TPA: alpha/beta fold hydrolase [bacterium]|nr:alpha/beta fold hydrolase [bacterium]
MKRAAMVGLLCVLLLTATACKVKVGPGDTAWRELVRAQRHDADLGGYTLHYIDLGRGEPVVMIHGFADSTYCWHENVAPLVSAGKRLILVDQPGMGNSGLPPAPYRYTAENQAGEILKLLDKLNIERFALVGSSMGGGISLCLSLLHPQRVTKAVVIDPAAYRMPDGAALAEPGMQPLVKVFGGRFFFRAALRQVYYDKNKVDDVLVDEYVRYANKDGYAHALTSLGRDYFSPEFDRMSGHYAELQPPVLAIWGLRDKWVPPAQGVRLAAQAPDCRLEYIPDAGHLPHQELPAAVNPLLVEFLGK